MWWMILGYVAGLALVTWMARRDGKSVPMSALYGLTWPLFILNPALTVRWLIARPDHGWQRPRRKARRAGRAERSC